MRTLLRQAIPTVAFVLVLALGGLILIPARFGSILRAADWAPKAPPEIYDPKAGPNAVKRRDYIVDVCANTDQLDCVEGIAAFLNGAWVEGTPTNTVNQGEGGVPNSRNWIIPGVTTLSGNGEITVIHHYNFTGNLFLTTSLRSPDDYGDRDANSLPRNVKFRATIRTSWVLPTHVSGPVSDARITVEKLATSGASRVTMEGIPLVGMVVLDDSAFTGETGKGSYEIREFTMTVSDGRFYPIKQDCIEKPSIMTADNGHGIALPKFTKGNFDLQVKSPHFRSDGITPHIGTYEASIPLETAKCLWGNTVTSASKFVVEVIEANGETKTATTSISVDEEAVTIKASGFTFSSPTIRVTYSAPTPTSSSISSSTSSTTSPSISAPSTSVAVVTPPKPTGLRATGGATTARITFVRTKGVTYSVVATKGNVRRSLRCALSIAKVSCSASGLASGAWKITVTPKIGGKAGAAGSTAVRVK